MKITIEYESSWRNSFLEGSNNEPLPKKGRAYIATSSNLNNPNPNIREKSFKKADLSIDTICGILNRLIGDQRKLYQSRLCKQYYFNDIEDKITFIDNPKKLISWEEIVYLRNMNGSYDREAFVGLIDTNHWLFNSFYSNELWSIWFLDLKKLIDFLLTGTLKIQNKEYDPREIIYRVKDFKPLTTKKLKEMNISVNTMRDAINVFSERNLNTDFKNLFPTMKRSFNEINYEDKERFNVRKIYCSALYLGLIRLSQRENVTPKNIKGFSLATLTTKNFMENFTSGKKRIYGNPYVKKERVKGAGEVTSMLTKASGQLSIELDIPHDKAVELSQLIENAGVSSFYLGKKGLAYVTNIRI